MTREAVHRQQQLVDAFLMWLALIAGVSVCVVYGWRRLVSWLRRNPVELSPVAEALDVIGGKK